MEHLENKKILYLVTQSKYGGAQKYILQLASHFKEKNKILIAVGERDNQDEYFFKEARSLGIEPIILNHLVRDISLVKGFDAVMEIRRLLVRERPDILHLNSSMAAALGSCAAWLYGFDPLNKLIRVVYTVHGFVFNEPLSFIKRQVYIFAERVSAHWKGAFITVSQYDKGIGLKHKIAPDRRIVVVHNGIDRKQSFMDSQQARHKLGIQLRSAFAVGTIASLYKTKGLEYLVHATHKLAMKGIDLSVVIIGDGPELQTLQRLAEKLGLAGILHFVGMREHAAQFLKAFDVFVLPSVKEGFPYTILEAGLAGVPIVASRVGGIPEIISHQETGLVTEPANPDDIATAIEYLKTHPLKGKEYAHNLKLRIEREFSLDAMLSKTEQVYCRFFQPRPESPSRPT